MTVYIVTRGYYSEYEIVAVFDDEAKAEAYIDGSIAHQDLRPLDGWRIEPMEVNATEPTPDKRVPRYLPSLRKRRSRS